MIDKKENKNILYTFFLQKEFSLIDVICLIFSILIAFLRFYDLFVVLLLLLIILRFYVSYPTETMLDVTVPLLILLLSILSLFILYETVGKVLTIQYSQYFQYSFDILFMK